MNPLAGRPDPLRIDPVGGPLDAVMHIPGSKSITNRALLCAALATGTSRLRGVLFADDTEAMLGCIAALGAGVRIDRSEDVVEVIGTSGVLRCPPGTVLDVKQSGTTARFIAAAALLSTSEVELDAAAQMRSRPMAPTFEALRSLGATVIETVTPGHLPARISGASHDERPTVRLAADLSSQFLSGLLLAAPCMEHGLRLELSTEVVSAPYLAMTVSVMRAFGAVVHIDAAGSYEVEPGGYTACDYVVEPDASAASYFFAAAAICGGSVRIDGLGSTSIQGDVGFVDLLASMGAIVEVEPDSIIVTGGTLRGIDADLSDISDTAQTFAAVAVHAEGPSRITGIGFIRAKETDRIGAVVTELRRCGIDARELEDGFEIHPGTVRPTVVHTYDDHRMAMSFALLGLRSPGIEIAGPSCVAKTFPDYFDALDSIRPETP